MLWIFKCLSQSKREDFAFALGRALGLHLDALCYILVKVITLQLRLKIALCKCRSPISRMTLSFGSSCTLLVRAVVTAPGFLLNRGDVLLEVYSERYFHVCLIVFRSTVHPGGRASATSPSDELR